MPKRLLTLSILALFAAALPPALAQNKAAQSRAVSNRGALDAEEMNNISVFKRVSPSVVHITTLSVQRDFFSLRTSEQPSGTGTGFVWDDSGHVVTNFHVIQGGDRATVTLADQSSYPAKLVGAFPDRDIAVLRIEAPATKLPAIQIGASRELQVGQKVYAIGNPFGLDQTLTTGIVSALNREIESVTRRTIKGAIQTDAAINPGNSGGPLLDSAGRLIGVNTAIYSPSGGSAGIGFAIPVDEVNRIVPRLIRDGRFIRPALGVTAGTEALAKALGAPKGVLLVNVAEASPAAAAGLKPFGRDRVGRIVQGDVITAVDGQAVADLDDMLSLLETRQIGEKVTLSVWRGGEAREGGPALGVTAGTEALAKALGAPKGVLLVNVAEASPAAAAGLKPFGRDRVGRIVQGDVITAVDGQAVADLDDMLSLLETRQIGEKVTLSVWRAGQTRKVVATLGSSD